MSGAHGPKRLREKRFRRSPNGKCGGSRIMVYCGHTENKRDGETAVATLADLVPDSAAESMPTRDYLLNAVDTIGLVEAFTMPSEELEALQLRAAQEFFELRRGQIAVLERRARETG